MKLKEKILNIVLRVMSIFLPFVKVNKDKITFISLESRNLEGDFKLVSEELQKKGKFEIHHELIKFEKNLKGYFEYFLICIRQLFVINSSALVVLDYNNYVVSNFKRKDVKVLQLWHSSGAIKKFGNLVERDYEIKNYDYTIVNSEYFADTFAKALNLDKQNVKVTGIPKTDILFDEENMKLMKQDFFARHPEVSGKKIILYAPTFRGRLMTSFQDVYLDLKQVKYSLGDEYVILYKLHPLVAEKKFENLDGVICCNDEDLYTLMYIADLLISDYSALIFDYSVFNKPMMFFVPDLKEYTKYPGIALDYEEEMPGPICFTEQEVIDGILKNDFDVEKIVEFQKKYYPYTDGKSTERVVTLIEDIMERRVL